MKVTLETVIGDIVDCDENTADIFLESGMHCITCPVSRMETVEEAAMVHGVDAEELVGIGVQAHKGFTQRKMVGDIGLRLLGQRTVKQ